MNIGPWQLLIVAIVILVLFGRGRISEMMGDFGKGIKSFKQGMNEEGRSPEQIDHKAAAPTAADNGAKPSPTPTPAPAQTTSGEADKSS